MAYTGLVKGLVLDNFYLKSGKLESRIITGFVGADAEARLSLNLYNCFIRIAVCFIVRSAGISCPIFVDS